MIIKVIVISIFLLLSIFMFCCLRISSWASRMEESKKYQKK